MREIELYLYEKSNYLLTDWEDMRIFKILSIPEDIDLWENIIDLDGKLYAIYWQQGNKYQIRELEKFDVEERENWGEEEITCPVCGFEFSDSWEFEDCGEITCGACGSELEWNRMVEVSYSTVVTKINEPIKLGEEEGEEDCCDECAEIINGTIEI